MFPGLLQVLPTSRTSYRENASSHVPKNEVSVLKVLSAGLKASTPDPTVLMSELTVCLQPQRKKVSCGKNGYLLLKTAVSLSFRTTIWMSSFWIPKTNGMTAPMIHLHFFLSAPEHQTETQPMSIP